MALERPLVLILNLCIQWVGDTRYPNIHRVSSVRTDYLPSRSPPRRGTTVKAGQGHPGSQHHLNQRILARIKLLGPREWGARPLSNWRITAVAGRGFERGS